MSAATRATTAAQRATIAARILKTQKSLYRAFDDCFEMNDGDQVLRIIQKRAAGDEVLKAAIIRHGCGNWLAADYWEKRGAA